MAGTQRVGQGKNGFRTDGVSLHKRKNKNKRYNENKRENKRI